MDFFEAQEAAKRRTFVLVGLFAAAVLAIIVSIYVVVVLVGGAAMGAEPRLDLGLFILVALGTSVLIGGGSAFRSAQLRKGGPAVAGLLGGRRVDPATRDPDERRLVNVVEEMAVASGTPVPAIFVLDGEPSINAFAAGFGIHDAAVAVTRGTLEQLNRDELQGVIAHEFSHILNGDMRLNVRLIGILFGILLLAIVGRGLVRGGAVRGRRRSDGRVAMIGLALILIGYIGVFFGKLIKAAVSRQREYLADAAAVQFTRNPEGIADALKKIGAHPRGARIEDHHAEELSHLFFANGVGSAFSRVVATHPPLEKRIRRIDPRWDGSFDVEPPKRREVKEADGSRVGTSPSGRAGPAGSAATGPGGVLPGAGEGAGLGMAAAAILMGTVGAPAPEHVDAARRLLDRIPDDLRDAAHDPVGAAALVLALLGGDDERSREARRTAAQSMAGMPGRTSDDTSAPSSAGLPTRLEALEPMTAGLAPEARLPLIDLALPTLRRMNAEAAAALGPAAEAVARADGTMRVFDFALLHILRRHLSRDHDRRQSPGGSVRSVRSVPREMGVLLSAVARAGAEGDDAAAAAFQAGVEALDGAAPQLKLLGSEGVDFGELDGALDRLERGTLDLRRQVLEACTAATLVDREVRTEEMELLRAVAECLELPLPLQLGTGAHS